MERCNCEKVRLENKNEFHTVNLEPSGEAQTDTYKFGIMYCEVHSQRWCAVVNSAGGMFQLKYGEQ